MKTRQNVKKTGAYEMMNPIGMIEMFHFMVHCSCFIVFMMQFPLLTFHNLETIFGIFTMSTTILMLTSTSSPLSFSLRCSCWLWIESVLFWQRKNYLNALNALWFRFCLFHFFLVFTFDVSLLCCSSRQKNK